ncbi:MAG: multiheme c-type cytochrome [Bacteroidales bacterium]
MKLPVKLPVILLIVVSVSFARCTKSTYNPAGTSGNYSVFAWNDLGMHCLNPSYDKLVILPPYNTLLVQVVKRGNPPVIVTSGVTVSYRILDNTTSYNKRSYGGFWDNSLKLFGVNLVHDVGLKGYGLSGDMAIVENHYTAEGIPVVPVDDSNNWNPYQVAEITVKDQTGATVAQTQTTIPTSDEMNCAKCHGADAFADILAKHDDNHQTTLSIQANEPVLCASCHPDPALGITTGSVMYLSQAIHGSHADRTGITCYDCHPGATTKCSRSLRHTAADGNCITCHGNMDNVATTIAGGRIPWNSEPACITCHQNVTGVSTGTALYKQSQGHGNMYCSSCHGSPHAMIPSREASDNYVSTQYQGFTSKTKTLGSCGVCHDDSRGPSNIAEFAGEHGGTNPRQSIGCSACHTDIPADAAGWPHAHTWTNSN